MATGNLETFVRRLFGDKAFKSSVLQDPDRAFAEYRLAGAEKVAARQLCQRLVTPEGMMASGIRPNGIWW